MQNSKRKAAYNMCFDIEWQCHIAGPESQIGSLVHRMRFSAKIPLHLKAQASSQQPYEPYSSKIDKGKKADNSR